MNKNYSIKPYADLRGADLCEAILRGADLYEANLYEANLLGAILCGANLCGANLYKANLCGANLFGANLCDADLYEANLRGANLLGANLCGANLRRTCLDSNNKPNKDVSKFKVIGSDYVLGFRTRKAGHIDMYRDGWTYSADWFSTADTECHPGLYIWPSLKDAVDFSGMTEFIKVKIPIDQIHKAGSKYRCRWFSVIGKA